MGRTKKGRRPFFVGCVIARLSIVMNRWNEFYQNIQDPSWPDCANEHEFFKLPMHIQEEIVSVFNGNDYLYLTTEDLHYVPTTVEHEINNNQFDLEFKVADDFVVYYNDCIEGGGIQVGQSFPRIVRCLYPNKTFENCLEWASGHGAIGFRLLSDSLCKNLHLLDCDPMAVDACKKTINYMPDRCIGSTTLTLTNTIETLDNALMFDLIVANPPAYQSRLWARDNFKNTPMQHWHRISYDKDWQAHQDFFKHIKQHLTQDGVILLQEQMLGSSVFEFEKFVDAGGLKIKSAFYEKYNRYTWYLELIHK